MGYPLMFGPPTLNVPTVHEFVVPVTIGSTSSSATWTGYGITITRPTSTTMLVTLPQIYGYLVDFHVGRKPAASSSQVSWIVTTDNLAVDGSVTLTSVSGGSATAPASTDVFYFTLRVTSDKLQDGFAGSCT